MSSLLYVVATVVAHPGQAEAVSAALRKIVAPSRAESTCLSYELAADNNNDHRFFVLEQWESKAALEVHMTTPHFKELVASIGSIADIRVDELTRLA